MNEILMCVAASGIFFGAMALRGIFGYLKNKKISLDDVKFDWKKFLTGSIKPVLLTLSIGALEALIIAFLTLVDSSGIEVQGLEQISIHNFLLGLFIADIGAIGYAIKEGLIAFGLSEKQILQIRETASNGETGLSIGIDSEGNVIASPETVTPKSDKELLNEDSVDVDDGEEIKVDEEPGKGAAWVNTYPEPYRSRPKDSLIDPSTCYSRECVSYCAWKICEATGSWPKRTGDMNAKSWVYRLPSWGYNRVSAPQNGGCYVGVLTSGKYGHVVWFEGGNTISEYNYNSAGNYTVRNINLGQYQWFQVKAAPAPAPTPTPTPTNFKVGDNVTLINWVDYNGNKLAKTRDYYTISEINGNRAVLKSGNVVYAAVNTSNLKSYNGSSKPNNSPKIGDRVLTSATKDRNGVNLNLRIINDGQSVWNSTDGKGYAILVKGKTIRCAVPASSLRKA